MMLTPCLNPATLPWGTSIDRFMEAASAAGFEAVEVSIQQVQQFVFDTSESAFEDKLEELGLSVEQGSGILPAGPVLPAPLLIPDAEYAQAWTSLPDRLAAFRIASCPRAAIVVDPFTLMSDTEARSVAVRRLTELAQAAVDHDVQLCVEFIGLPGGLDEGMSGGRPFVRNIADLVGLLSEIPSGNVRVLLDVFHWMATGGVVADIGSLGVGDVGMLQISDVGPESDPAEVNDADRIVPGDGVVDWTALGRALIALSYSGPISVELFNPELWQRPIPEICESTLRGAHACREKMMDGGGIVEAEA